MLLNCWFNQNHNQKSQKQRKNKVKKLRKN